MAVQLVMCPSCHHFFLTYARREATCRRCGSRFGLRSRAGTRIVCIFEDPGEARVSMGILNSVEGPMTIDQARHLVLSQGGMGRGFEEDVHSRSGGER
jgi:hypothetical protein